MPQIKVVLLTGSFQKTNEMLAQKVHRGADATLLIHETIWESDRQRTTTKRGEKKTNRTWMVMMMMNEHAAILKMWHSNVISEWCHENRI